MSLKDKNTYAYLNDDGLIEVIDQATGEVIARENEIIDDSPLQTVPIQGEDGNIVWVEKGLRLEDISLPKLKYAFSPMLGDIVCQKITEGKSLSAICKEDGMPSYAIISKWRRDHEEFAHALAQAREDRAEIFHDKAIDEGTGEIGKDEVAAQRLKVDTYKWGAGVGNPGKYSPQQKLTHEGNAAVAFIIETGIRRPGDTGYDNYIRDAEVVHNKLEGGKDGQEKEVQQESKEGSQEEKGQEKEEGQKEEQKGT